MDNIRLISGRSNQELASSIATKLGLPLTSCKIGDFANSEIGIQIMENVRGTDVFIIATGCSDSRHSVNDYFMEMKLIASACKLSSAKSIAVICPTFP